MTWNPLLWYVYIRPFNTIQRTNNHIKKSTVLTPLKPQIRAAEDILALTRTMKETWLFGKLDTLGEDERDVKRREDLENDALAIQKVIEGDGLLKPAK